MKQIICGLMMFMTVLVETGAAELRGFVVKIEDGDTLTLLVDHNQHRIRLAQIDAPEVGHGAKRLGQPFGQASKNSLADLAFNKNAVARCTDPDQYGRLVCDVLIEGKSVNKEQVRRGMAWTYTRYATDPTYQIAQDKARGAGLGLWADSRAMEPWIWRHKVWESNGATYFHRPVVPVGPRSAIRGLVRWT